MCPTRANVHVDTRYSTVIPCFVGDNNTFNLESQSQLLRSLKARLGPGLLRSRPMCRGPLFPTTSTSPNVIEISTTPLTNIVAENASLFTVLLKNENATWFHEPELMVPVESAPMWLFWSLVTLSAIRLEWGHNQAEGVPP